MSPRTEKQFEEIRKSKKELILNTALEEFAEHGYHATSINTISKKANISKGLIYNYFESKECLLKAIVIKGLAVMIEAFDQKETGFLTEDEFDFFIDKTFESLQKNMKFWRLYFSIIMKAGVVDLIKEPMMEYLQPFINTMTNYYAKQGDINPVASAILLGSVLDGVCIDYIMEPEMYPLNDIKKIIIKKFK